MKPREIRKQMQSDLAFELSDYTRNKLSETLKQTRQECGGISLAEIAEVISESFDPKELELIKSQIGINVTNFWSEVEPEHQSQTEDYPEAVDTNRPL